MATDSQDKALKPADIAHAVLAVVANHGELDTEEVIREMTTVEPEVEAKVVEQAIKMLDRRGHLTRSNQLAGWQVTGTGRDAMQQLSAKQIAPFVAPYANYQEVTAEFELLSPSLGPKTGPGGAGKSLFPRLPDGRVILLGGWIRAALAKAVDRMEPVIAHDLAGKPKALPKAAWDHVLVRPVILPADVPMVESIRRPVNERGQAIGEIIHEGLAPGVVLRVRARLPLSHFPEPYLRALFAMMGDVGISPAGSGKGGIWGVAELLNLTIGDQGAAEASERANGHAVLSA